MSQTEFLAIISLINHSRNNAVKAVNSELINLYWNLGAYISKQLSNSNWGEKTVDELAKFIEINHPDLKGFNKRGLYRMKQFYETYCDLVIVSPLVTQLQDTENQNNTIVSPLVTQLYFNDIRDTILAKITWTNHLILLSRTQTTEEKHFYLKMAIQENYSKRELERQISAGLFERIMIGNDNQSTALKKEYPNAASIFKDGYIFEFLNLPEIHNEADLQKGLISQMKNFITELGKDFLFIGEEYKVQVGNSDFYIDLLFYHRSLQCLVAFELKADKFKPEHLGQINFYLEALDRDVKKHHENPSIGILLCKDKDNEVVEYALSRSLSPTMVALYKTQLPDKKILQQKLHELFEMNNTKE